MDHIKRFQPLAEDFRSLVPYYLPALETMAVVVSRTEGIASRTAYEKNLNKYLLELPENYEAAKAQVETEAAKILGVPALATCASKTSNAAAALAAAESELRSCRNSHSAIMGRLRSAEAVLEDQQARLEAWQCDFDAMQFEAEAMIEENYHRPEYKARIAAELSRIAGISTLREIAHRLIPKLKSDISNTAAEIKKINGSRS